MVTKATFRVVKPITKVGVTREPGYTLTVGAHGFHVNESALRAKCILIVERAPSKGQTL